MLNIFVVGALKVGVAPCGAAEVKFGVVEPVKFIDGVAVGALKLKPAVGQRRLITLLLCTLCCVL
jgi:hypothetical protein